MPANIRLSHARFEPMEASSYSVLGEVAISTGRAGRMSHSLNLGAARRVDQYLRLDFTGNLLPVCRGARSPGAFLLAIGFLLSMSRCQHQLALAHPRQCSQKPSAVGTTAISVILLPAPRFDQG